MGSDNTNPDHAADALRLDDPGDNEPSTTPIPSEFDLLVDFADRAWWCAFQESTGGYLALDGYAHRVHLMRNAIMAYERAKLRTAQAAKGSAGMSAPRPHQQGQAAVAYPRLTDAMVEAAARSWFKTGWKPEKVEPALMAALLDDVKRMLIAAHMAAPASVSEDPSRLASPPSPPRATP